MMVKVLSPNAWSSAPINNKQKSISGNQWSSSHHETVIASAIYPQR